MDFSFLLPRGCYDHSYTQKVYCDDDKQQQPNGKPLI